MSEFELKHNETVAENITRILTSQADNVKSHCKAGPDKRHEAIHEIRKSIKRIRAILRLVRGEIGYSTYYRENIFYRDLNRSLSDIRALNVLVASSRVLQSDLSDTLEESRFNPLIGSLQEKRDQMLDRLILKENLLHSILKQMDSAKRRIRKLPIEHNDFRAFDGGLTRIYKQGLLYRDLSQAQPVPENIHNLRKRIKYHWYHMQILQPISPSILKPYTETLDMIGENLGQYHDLAELQSHLELNPGILENHLQSTLTDGCEIKKTSILNRIWKDVEAVYSEKPGDLARRFARYWEIYQKNHSYIKTL